jgi:DNA polymerase I-like protein with 3'-5' exonuclease and polymerase domains
VVKKAMVTMSPVLPEIGIDLLLQVHDELMFEHSPEDAKHIGKIINVMENAYPHKHLPLTCSTSHSLNSWGDMKKGELGEKTGNNIQGEGL